jgi:hypothetical protein
MQDETVLQTLTTNGVLGKEKTANGFERCERHTRIISHTSPPVLAACALKLAEGGMCHTTLLCPFRRRTEGSFE